MNVGTATLAFKRKKKKRHQNEYHREFIVRWCQQVALDNTKKKLQVSQPLFEGEEEVDLYTDEQINGGQRVRNEERPHPKGSAPSPAAKTHSNGVSSPASSASASAREDMHISTLNCQLTKMSPLEQDVTNAVRVKDGKLPCEEATFNKDDPQSQSQQVEPVGLCKNVAEAENLCSCLQSSDIFLKHCIPCNTLHNTSCTLLQDCIVQGHYVALPDATTNHTIDESNTAFPPGACRGGASPALAGCSAAASPLAICDDSNSISQPPKPIPFHYCCDLSEIDLQVLCLSCGLFHSRSCREIDFCQKHHKFKLLGVCSCGRQCSRKPLVLCRYCGNEYCRQCWFRNPVACTCGQTFDQSPVWFFFLSSFFPTKVLH